MKINFDNDSFIDVYKSSDDKVAVILAAKDSSSPHKLVVSSAEISLDEWKKIVENIEKN